MRERLTSLLAAFASFAVASAISLIPTVSTDPSQYLRGLVSGLFFAFTGLSAVFSVVGINFMELMKPPTEAILVSKVEQFNPAAGMIGYNVMIENTGTKPAQEVTVRASATGNLQFDRPVATWRAIGAGRNEVFILAGMVPFGTLSLDQEIRLNIAWKDSWRKRKAEDRFNLKQIDDDYRAASLAQLGGAVF